MTICIQFVYRYRNTYVSMAFSLYTHTHPIDQACHIATGLTVVHRCQASLQSQPRAAPCRCSNATKVSDGLWPISGRKRQLRVCSTGTPAESLEAHPGDCSFVALECWNADFEDRGFRFVDHIISWAHFGTSERRLRLFRGIQSVFSWYLAFSTYHCEKPRLRKPSCQSARNALRLVTNSTGTSVQRSGSSCRVLKLCRTDS